MTIKLANENAAMQLATALNGTDEQAIATAFQAWGEDIANQIREDYEELQQSNDAAIMQARGYRQLTTPEREWYQKVITALRQPPEKARQAFIDIIHGDNVEDIMPETIIEDVMRYIAESRPLLNAVNFQYVGYTTKWIINDNSVQRGSWGEVGDAITAEIKGSLKVLDITQAKYSAYAVIPLDLLDMGPTYLDAFIRATLAETIALGTEEAIIKGTGYNQPCGLMRDPNSALTPETGYTAKTAVKVTDFLPAEYGKLVAKLAKTEKGKMRSFGKVTLICNMVDYLTKIMPATTVLTANGTYANDLFPFPTDVIPSSVMEEGKAILCLLDEYTYAVGGSRNGVIEYSDEFRFLDDARTFRVVTHAAGRAYDNTSAIVLDISALKPAYVTVQVAQPTEAASIASAGVRATAQKKGN